MKRKVLLMGNQRAVINEFFTYMDFSFECMTTSDRYDDIVNHIKYMRPEVFVYCMQKENMDDIKRFLNVWHKFTEREIPVVIIGDAEDCSQFVRLTPRTDYLMLTRPILAKKVEEAILDLLEQRKKAGDAPEPEPEEEKKPLKKTADTSQIKKEVKSIISVLDDEKAASEKPAAPSPEEPEKPAAPSPEQSERRTHILVIDDDSSVLKLIKGYLVERYDVATAISGKIGIKFMENKGTDLVLLDYEMPAENGAEILRQIRANNKIKDTPVVFLTGVGEKEKIMEMLSLHPQGYLKKPIDMERLSTTIKGVLG